MKAAIFDEESKGQKYEWVEIPDDLKAKCAEMREKMIEACADVDDGIMAKFLDGKSDQVTEAEIVAALRKGCCGVQAHPGALRLGVQEQGRAAPARRGRQLPPVAARHPRRSKGVNPDNDKAKSRARPTTSEPFAGYAFKIINDPHGNLTFFRVYSGRSRAARWS